jgi:hypothetical protein
MKNTVVSFDPTTDTRNIEHYRRESSFRQGVKLIDLDNGNTPIDARFYGSGATVYCVVWIMGDAQGYGKAGGYGYHKASTAFEEALSRAGVRLGQWVGGVGDGAIDGALLAIAEHLGIARPLIVKAHG